MTIPSRTQQKSQLRAAMRRLLRETPQDSRPVAEALGRWLRARPGLHTIAVFSALPDEVDLSAFVALHEDRRWVYPLVNGNELSFHAVTNPALDLAPGAFGIREPHPGLPEIAAGRIDAFFCPGLAFDPHGGRLGRGRGFYDRMLARARPDALKIGVCFPNQIVPGTFSEPHDIHMDEVVCGEDEEPPPASRD